MKLFKSFVLIFCLLFFLFTFVYIATILMNYKYLKEFKFYSCDPFNCSCTYAISVSFFMDKGH